MPITASAQRGVFFYGEAVDATPERASAMLQLHVVTPSLLCTLFGGFVSRDAFYLFRGARPLREMIAVEKSLAQKLALSLLGPAVIRAHPFEPMYFLRLARVVRQAVRMPLVLLGGITALAHLQAARREGFELAAMGRALIHDPALIARFAAGSARESGCVPCNRCVAEMDREGGVRCARVPEQLAERERSLRVIP